MRMNIPAKSVVTTSRFATKAGVAKVHNANGSGVKRAGLARNAAKRRPPRSDDPVAKRASRTPHGLPAIKGKLLPATSSIYVGRLSTVFDWHRQVGKIYREMRRHQIDPGLGTRLTYVANIGATLAKFIEELPQDLNVPPDLSRLDDAELQQLEYLLAKAAGPKALEHVTKAIAPGDED